MIRGAYTELKYDLLLNSTLFYIHSISRNSINHSQEKWTIVYFETILNSWAYFPSTSTWLIVEGESLKNTYKNQQLIVTFPIIFQKDEHFRKFHTCSNWFFYTTCSVHISLICPNIFFRNSCLKPKVISATIFWNLIKIL